MGRPALELTGRRFGQWLVLERVHIPDEAASFWRCQCTCGERGIVRGAALNSGRSTRCTSCGDRATSGTMQGTRYKDLTGQVFGRWTVLAKSHMGAGRNIHWLCRCTCGTQSTVAGFSLRSGHSKQCRDCANNRRGERP